MAKLMALTPSPLLDLRDSAQDTPSEVMLFLRPTPVYDPWDDMTWQRRFHMWTSGWRGVLTILAIVVLVLGWWKGAGAYRWLKVKRAEHLVAQSEKSLEKGDTKEALVNLSQAIALVQRHPLTLRAMAHYKLAAHDVTALDAYLALIQTGGATAEDKLSFTQSAFRMGRPDLAAPVLQELNGLPETRDKCAVLTLEAGQEASAGHWDNALSLSRKAVKSEGSEEDVNFAKLVLARMLLQAPVPAPATSSSQPGLGPSSALLPIAASGLSAGDQVLVSGLKLQLPEAPQDSAHSRQVESVGILSTLAHRPDTTGLEALQTLASLSEHLSCEGLFQPLDIQALLDAADANPQAKPALKVNLWNLRWSAEPEAHTKVTEAFLEHFKANALPEVRLEAARWLNQKGSHQMALDLSEPNKLESEDWLLVYVDAAAALGKWRDVLKMLSTPDQKIPLPGAVRQLFVLRCQMALGERLNPSDSWRDIEIACQTEKPSTQLYIATYAAKVGFPAEAAIIYKRLLQEDSGGLAGAGKQMSRSQRMACYASLLGNHTIESHTQELCDLAHAFATEFPEVDEIQNESAYLELLYGRNVEEASKTAQRLWQSKPEVLAYLTTQALSSIRHQNGASAAALYDGHQIDWNTAPDPAKAVFVASMHSAGRAEEAEKVQAKIKLSHLRPEERHLAGIP